MYNKKHGYNSVNLNGKDLERGPLSELNGNNLVIIVTDGRI